MLFRLGTDFIASIVTGFLIGYWIDKWLQTTPFFLILFIILGFLAGCRTIFKAMTSQPPDHKKEE